MNSVMIVAMNAATCDVLNFRIINTYYPYLDGLLPVVSRDL